MFKQMRHTCFAVVFHTAAHEISRVDRSRGFALVCKKNNLQTIVEFIAFDAFDRCTGFNAAAEADMAVTAAEVISTYLSP